jgi:GTP-binding protein EngB required for normal cell division
MTLAFSWRPHFLPLYIYPPFSTKRNQRNQTQPNATKRNQTQPNATKRNQTQPNATPNMYANILSSLEKIRTLTGAEGLQLPQITVIGDQSSGKSSLLEALTGFPFPTNAGITTKCPIVVHTCKTQAKKATYTIDEKEIKYDALATNILALQRLKTATCKVSQQPITIRAEGCDMNDLVLVDLPGIIANGPGKVDVIAMIKKYITPEQSLILVVTEAKSDDENAQALELVKMVDPDEQRTLRVLTKFDVFDSEETRKRAEEMIVSGEGPLRPHAVICRINGSGYDSADERQKLGLIKDLAGVSSLKERLPDLLCRLIKTNLPNLKQQVNGLIKESEKTLEKIGRSPPDCTQVLIDVQRQLVVELNIKLTSAMHSFRENIHDTRKSITYATVEDLYRHDAFTCIFFQGNRTFEKCVEKYHKSWIPIVDNLFDSVSKTMREHLPTLEGVSSVLRGAIKESWWAFCNALMEQLDDKMQEELTKEKRFKTMNHYITAKYDENLTLDDKTLKDIRDSIVADTISRTLKKTQDNIMKLIEAALECRAAQYESASLDDQHKQRILAAVKANWAVSKKSLIDNMLSVVLTIAVDGKAEWLQKTLMSDPTIRASASEDLHTKKERERHLKRLIQMGECREILAQY